MHQKPSYMDSPHHVISNGRGYATWFLTVEKLCPLKVEGLDIRIRSYKLAPKLIKSEDKKLQGDPKFR